MLRRSLSALLIAGLLGALAGVAGAQPPTEPRLQPGGQPQAQPQQQQQQRQQQPERTQREREQPGVALRSSDLVGMNVRNPAGEDLGQIDELVFDLETGEIRYAAVSFGGFLGIGDKLFAVPWDAFEIRQNDNGRYLLLNIDRQRLEQAEGFDRDNWPDFGDQRFTQQVDQFYEQQRRQRNAQQQQRRGARQQPQPGRNRQN